MASSMRDDASDGKSNNSDNPTAVCGYEDVNQFSQVTNFRCHAIFTHVMHQMSITLVSLYCLTAYYSYM